MAEHKIILTRGIQGSGRALGQRNGVRKSH